MSELDRLLDKSKPPKPPPRPVDLTPEEYLVVRMVLMIARAESKQRNLHAYFVGCGLERMLPDLKCLTDKLTVTPEEIARQYLSLNG